MTQIRRWRVGRLVVPVLMLALAACNASATSPSAERRGAEVGDGSAVAQAAATQSAIPASDGAARDSVTADQPASTIPSSADDQIEPAVQSCPPPVAGRAAPPTRTGSQPPPVVGAATAVVIDAGSGAVLWGHDERRRQQPASVTKIVTALLAIERGALDDLITVNIEDRRFLIGSRMGLVQGDRFSLRDLLYGLMLPSGNDAAIVIAQYLAGTEAAFAEQMTARMCALGLTDSSFLNASGLGRGEYNLTSAYDLAQVSRVAMELPAFVEIASARSWTARGSRTLSMSNLNELVSSYPGADGIKIGWTPTAGSTIVGSAMRNGHRVIVVLMNTPNRAGESAALLNWAFSSFTWPNS